MITSIICLIAYVLLFQRPVFDPRKLKNWSGPMYYNILATILFLACTSGFITFIGLVIVALTSFIAYYNGNSYAHMLKKVLDEENNEVKIHLTDEERAQVKEGLNKLGNVLNELDKKIKEELKEEQEKEDQDNPS